MTDDEFFHWLITIKEQRDRLARWMVKIQDYYLFVQYVLREIITVPDSLSRDAVKPNIFPHCKAKNRRSTAVNQNNGVTSGRIKRLG